MKRPRSVAISHQPAQQSASPRRRGRGPTRRASAPAAASPAAFTGTWHVRRKIVDHLARTTATFTGQATIAPARFEEAGELALATTVLNATRAYRLRFGRRAVSVTHPDGSPFIRLEARPAQTVRHQCGADLYVGRFFFLDADTWAEAWRVVGPRKRYASLSHYRRVTASSE